MKNSIARACYSIMPRAIQRRLFDPRQLALRHKLKKRILECHANSQDPEIQEALSFIKKYKLTTYNYEFIFEYDTRKVKVFRDPENSLFFVVEDGKRLYFKRSLDAEYKVADYYNAMCKEQDPRSPHRYANHTFAVAGGVILDLGAAEGLFSLRAIDQAEALYLFECDDGWVEALTQTFKPYAGKVHIINKYVSDVDSEREVSLDTFASAIPGNISFIKMDIEGAEIKALRGAQQLLRKSPRPQWSICAYHRHDDEKNIRDLMRDYHVEASPGFVLYFSDQTLQAPYFRRGVLYADP